MVDDLKNLDDIRALLIKHKRDNFWGVLDFLITSGYHEIEAYDIAKTIHPKLCNEKTFLIQNVDNVFEVVIYDPEQLSPHIVELIDFGIEIESNFANFPVKMLEHYLITFKVNILVEFLIKQVSHLDCKGKIITEVNTPLTAATENYSWVEAPQINGIIYGV